MSKLANKAVEACWFNIDTWSKLHKTSINNISQWDLIIKSDNINIL